MEPDLASPLPWSIKTLYENLTVRDARGDCVCELIMPKDGDYLVHTANAHPKIMELVKTFKAKHYINRPAESIGKFSDLEELSLDDSRLNDLEVLIETILKLDEHDNPSL